MQEYVLEELNVRELETCNDILQYATIKAEPNWANLGKRLGKDMGKVGTGNTPVFEKIIKSLLVICRPSLHMMELSL
jgi:hypothetical protein